MIFNGESISRRTVLRGLGVTMGLPFLEAMLPKVIGQNAGTVSSSAAASPRRMAFIYIPNGGNMTTWFPRGATGADYTLSPALEPMAPYREDMLVLGNMTVDKGRPNGDGAGDHARASGAWLTGAQVRKTQGADFRAGISADQWAAQQRGNQTRLPSLEVNIERYRGTGNCDSGYSCVYETTLAWRNATTPIPSETDPRTVFNRLFAARANDPAVVEQNHRRDSILNAVLAEAHSLQTRLGGADRQKLDQYLDTVNELEQRIARSDALEPVQLPDGTVAPRGTPSDLSEHHTLMADLIALAFQTDVTRVVTHMFGKEGSELQYRMIGITGGHHSISHHQNRQDNLDKLTQITTYHVQRLAYLVGKLKSITEGERTLLDNCMIAFGSGNADSNSHRHENVPTLLVGKGGGTIRTGQYMVYPRETPLTNLWLAMLERFGAPAPRIGDSTGVLQLPT